MVLLEERLGEVGSHALAHLTETDERILSLQGDVSEGSGVSFLVLLTVLIVGVTGLWWLLAAGTGKGSHVESGGWEKENVRWGFTAYLEKGMGLWPPSE